MMDNYGHIEKAEEAMKMVRNGAKGLKRAVLIKCGKALDKHAEICIASKGYKFKG